MKIAQKIAEKHADQFGKAPVTIAFIGDSVTQGCFECEYNPELGYFGPTEYENSFACHVGQILRYLCPSTQVNIVNSGIGGDKATGGLARFDRDIAPYHPDLVVIGYALNDCGHGPEGLPAYREAMQGLIRKTREIGAECILLTPNHMNDRVSPYLTAEPLMNTARAFLGNCLDDFVVALRGIGDEEGVPVCDVYARWQAWRESGVNTTELLANRLNHPRRELHWMVAYLLVETIFHA